MAFGSLLLNDALLDGAHAVERELGPPRLALAVAEREIADAVTAVGELSLVWGGAAGALTARVAGVGWA